MEINDPALTAYAEKHSSAEPDLLKLINAETHASVPMPRMLSGHLQGRMLAMFSRMIRPRRILEIGTYTGYSALCLAEGLTADGMLITLDINQKLEERVRGYFARTPLGKKIDYRIGNALEIIPALNESFDLALIDADKVNYGNYLDLVIPKMNKGGFILADNVLWSGKVLDAKPDKDTRSILAFNEKVMNDPRLEKVILPVRDGITVIAC